MTEHDIPLARDVMVRDLITVAPDLPALEAIAVLCHRDISGAPVVGPRGELLGLLSEHDCLRALANAEYHEDGEAQILVVSDLMTRMSHTIPPDTDLYAIAAKFVTLRVRRLPVVENGRLLGQVSRRDVLEGVLALRRLRRFKPADTTGRLEGPDLGP
ncbi:MAG: CBS domain-containing protein [Planctomycetota bacterium]